MRKMTSLPIRLNIGLPITLNVSVYSIKSSKNSMYLKPLTKCCKKPRQAKYVCSGCGKEVGNDYNRGYKTGKDSYIEISEKELETLSDLDKGFDLIGFVDKDKVNLNALSTAYPLEAQDNKDLYSLLYEALKETGKVMFGKFVLKGSSNLNNQQFCIIRVSNRNNALVLQKLELTDEISLERKELSDSMKEQLKSIKKFIQSNSLKKLNVDDYELTKMNEVEKLIENKLSGKEIKVIEVKEKPKEQKVDFTKLEKAKINA
ncbi:MAG: Ku protein [Atribacterota bacterium]